MSNKKEAVSQAVADMEYVDGLFDLWWKHSALLIQILMPGQDKEVARAIFQFGYLAKENPESVKFSSLDTIQTISDIFGGEINGI